jgi:hypothetical protein
VVSVSGCDWSDRITPGLSVLNHSSTARSGEPCQGLYGISAYEEVPLKDAAVTSPVPNGPATPWVTELYVPNPVFTSLAACGAPRMSARRQ